MGPKDFFLLYPHDFVVVVNFNGLHSILPPSPHLLLGNLTPETIGVTQFDLASFSFKKTTITAG